MFTNYIKIALRTLRRHPGYTFINVFGLAIGIGFCALLLLYVNDELTFDTFHANGDRIYRAQRVTYNEDGSPPSRDVYLPMPWGPSFQADFPEVENYVRFCSFVSHFVRHSEVTLEENVIYADPSIFQMFSFPLVYGSPESALIDMNAVVLTERAAARYFGDQNPVGQTLEVRLEDQFEPFTVTAVAENPPGNSSIQFDILLPFAKLQRDLSRFAGSDNNWRRSAFNTYVALKEGSTLSTDDARLLSFRETYYPDTEASLREQGHWTREGPPVTYALQPLADVHLNTDVPGGMTPPSDPLYSYILLGIAMAVLLIACINFTTLAVGRSVSRSREVGVRKVVGARRRQLMGQFWGESVLLSVFALVLGLILAALFLPTFNALTGKALSFSYVANPVIFLLISGLVLLASLIAGGYPAVVLSSFKPIDTLRSRLGLKRSNTLTRALVVVQFTLSVFLIVSTLIMLQQLDYLRSRNLGFDQEQIVSVHLNGVPAERALALMQDELGSRVDIEAIAAANLTFGEGSGWGRQGFDHNGELKTVYEYRVTPNYLETLQMELAHGRNFNPNLASDTLRAAIVNEALIRDFGWEDDPIGQVLTGYLEDANMDPIVIGVVKDYNFRPLTEAVEPMILMAGPTTGQLRTLLIRMNTTRVTETFEAIREAWGKISQDIPFEYEFMEEDIARFYADEARWSAIIGYSSIFAIFIACLGLLGLTSVMVVRRTKEVGIRKVLGASVSGIVGLLSYDFLKLVLIAFVLAAPLAFFAMREWLSGFAYSVDLGVSVFLLSGFMAVAVAFLTISYQAIRTALSNPVNALRAE